MKNAMASCAVLAFVALVSTSMLAVFQGMSYSPYTGDDTKVFNHLMIN